LPPPLPLYQTIGQPTLFFGRLPSHGREVLGYPPQPLHWFGFFSALKGVFFRFPQEKFTLPVFSPHNALLLIPPFFDFSSLLLLFPASPSTPCHSCCLPWSLLVVDRNFSRHSPESFTVDHPFRVPTPSLDPPRPPLPPTVSGCNSLALLAAHPDLYHPPSSRLIGFTQIVRQGLEADSPLRAIPLFLVVKDVFWPTF